MTARPSIAAPLAVLALALLSLPLGALAEEGSSDIPRRPDGRPDLSGTYDTATLTPLQRPAAYGDRLELTPEEARELAEHWLGNLAKDYEASDPEREAPPEGGVEIFVPEFSGAAGKVGGYNAFYVDIGESGFQIDGKHRTSIVTDPPNGRLPAMTELGQRMRSEASVFRHENTGTAWWMDLDIGPYDDPELRPLGERCILFRSRSGPPTLPAMYNNLKRVIQTDDHLMILAEQVHDARIVRIGGEHDSDVPRWMGDSVGHWEGDTLVVETTNFLESTGDRNTLRELKVTERFSRIDGEALLYQFTVEDPRFEEPWSGEYPWPATDGKVYEYACHEGNYALGGILRGARILEEDAGE